MNQKDDGQVDRQLALEVDAAIGVLGDEPEAKTLLRNAADLPPRILQRELKAAIVDLGFSDDEAERVAAASVDDEKARGIAPAVIASLRSDAALSDCIGVAISNRQELMAADPVTLGLAALVLLVLRTNRLRISRKGVEVDLQPLRAGIVREALALLKPWC